VEKNGKASVKAIGGEIATERDGLTLIAACIERCTNLDTLPTDCLSPQFLQSSTWVAGLVVQKRKDYGIRATALLNIESTSPRFREFALQSNHSTTYHICKTVDEAERWLVEERAS
jgi:hypothetical protein